MKFGHAVELIMKLDDKISKEAAIKPVDIGLIEHLTEKKAKLLGISRRLSSDAPDIETLRSNAAVGLKMISEGLSRQGWVVLKICHTMRDVAYPGISLKSVQSSKFAKKLMSPA